MIAITEKQCKVCKKRKPLAEFAKHRSSNDGHQHACHKCVSKVPDMCRVCHRRPCAPRYHVCQKCRHGDPVPCPTCDGVKRPEAKQCATCYRKFAKGANHGSWKGGRIIDKHGYARVYAPEDDRANLGRYMKEHTLVMEQQIGRRLMKGETVHHINGDRSDNRIENLEPWTKSHPAGQRVVDKVNWATEILEQYGDLV